jgi:ketosteroid isomerase-like protein
MKRAALPFTVVLLALTLAACTDTAVDMDCAATFDAAAMRKMVTEKNAEFTGAHITGDSLTLITYFTPDAKVFPPNADPVIGHPAIAALNAEWVAFDIKEFREETTDLYGCGDILVDEGNYFFAYGDDNTGEEGKYLNVWKKVDGEWKVYSNMWSANAPPTTTE